MKNVILILDASAAIDYFGSGIVSFPLDLLTFCVSIHVHFAERKGLAL